MSLYERQNVERYLDMFESGDAIALIWQVDDVTSLAIDMGVELSDQEARDILWEAARRHDANEGISWIVLETLISMYATERDNEQA